MPLRWPRRAGRALEQVVLTQQRGGATPQRFAISATRDSIVGTTIPWRRAARSTAPAIASSSDSRPAATSRAMELPRLGSKPARSSSASDGSTAAPSARATAAVSTTARFSRAPQLGSSRMAPSNRPDALVVHAKAFKRTSFDQRTSGSEPEIAVSMPAPLRLAASDRTAVAAPSMHHPRAPSEHAVRHGSPRRHALNRISIGCGFIPRAVDYGTHGPHKKWK